MTIATRVPAARRPQTQLSTRGRRRPFRQFLIVSHRWLSLVLGLVLLLITTSGSLLLYRPELQRVLNHDAYAASGGPARVSMQQAWDTVSAAHPKFTANSVVLEHGVFKVTDYTTAWTVDPATGQILGHIGQAPTWIGFLDNLHECGLSCDTLPGYLKALNSTVPYTAWLADDAPGITWGSLGLGVLGVLLLFLSLSGLWLWFPRPRQWRTSMTVRFRRGRFARDLDLHKVAGMIALPALLIWAITGAGFELKPMEQAWYALTPGGQSHYPDPVSKKSNAPDISVDQAVAAARAAYPDAKVVSVDVPAKDDATAAYTLWLSNGFDPYGATEYPGDLGVGVDRHTGVARAYYGNPGESTAQQLWEGFSYPVHAGYIVNGWWRLIWLALSLSPLLLAWTGVSTWLVRLQTKRARRAAARLA